MKAHALTQMHTHTFVKINKQSIITGKTTNSQLGLTFIPLCRIHSKDSKSILKSAKDTSSPLVVVF